MKSIAPVSTWVDGQEKVAKYLSCRIIADDLATSATFYYELKAESEDAEGNKVPGETVAVGNASLSGEEYQNWDDSNDQAYQLVAAQKGLTIV